MYDAGNEKSEQRQALAKLHIYFIFSRCSGILSTNI